MERLFRLQSKYQPSGDQPEAIASLVDGVQKGYKEQTLLGVTGSGKTFTMANIIAQANRPAVIFSHNKTLAAQLYGEMKGFFPDAAVNYFVSYYDYYHPEYYSPVTDTYMEKELQINEQIDQMRLSAIRSVMTRKDSIVICSVSSIFGLGEPDQFVKMLVSLRVGQEMSFTELKKNLVNLQYELNAIDFKRGTFRCTGDTIDIFPAEDTEIALRVTFFDNEIENLQRFDPITGKKFEKLKEFVLFPRTHFVVPRGVMLKAVEEIKTDMQKQEEYFLSQQKLIENQRIRERTTCDIESMLYGGYCSGIENYSRYFTGRAAGDPPPCLFDYIDPNALLFIDESHVTVPQIKAMYKSDRARKENLVNFGFRLPSAYDNRPLTFEEFQAAQRQTIYVSATPNEFELEQSQQVVEQLIRPTGLLDPSIEVRPTEHQIEDVMSEIKIRAERHERVLITVMTKLMAETLTDFLDQHGVRVRYLHHGVANLERTALLQDLRDGLFDVLVGINLLREGLDLPEVSLVAVLDADQRGFLRSARSLSQIVGRAARNVHGMAIFYGDTITPAMKETIDETNRRRTLQKKWNEEHGVIPHQVKRDIVDVMQTALDSSAAYKVPVEKRPKIKSHAEWEAERGINTLPAGNRAKQVQTPTVHVEKDLATRIEQSVAALKSQRKAVAVEDMDLQKCSDRQLKSKITALTKKMNKLAQDMKFEEAAKVRDQVMLLDKTMRARIGR